MLAKANRITRKADFDRLFAAGKPLSHALFRLRVTPNDLDLTRAGIICGKRIGGAVLRNRTRRRLRAALRQALASVPPAWDILVVVRPAAATATVADFVCALDELLRRGDVVVAPAET